MGLFKNMENAFIAAEGGEELDAQSAELARLLAELVSAGWQIQLRVVPNEWMAVSQAEIYFEHAWDAGSKRTAQEDLEAVRQGFAPQAPVHWKFDPFDPLSIYKAVKRFHHLFVKKASSD